VIDIGDAGGTFDAEGFSELQLGRPWIYPGGQGLLRRVPLPGIQAAAGLAGHARGLARLALDRADRAGVMVHYDVDRLDTAFVEAYLGRTFASHRRRA